MSKIRFSLSMAMIVAILMFSHPSCWATWSFQLNNNFNFSKGNLTIENLDRHRYIGTAVTTDFTASRDFFTYLLTPEVIWTSPDWHIYATVNGSYGWLFDGKVKKDPLQWKVDGTEKQFNVEVGYIMDVCGRFNFLPHTGFFWDRIDTRLKHQQETRANPICYMTNNGNRTRTLFYFPYIGFELNFNKSLPNCKTVQLSMTYDIGYGGGHGRNTVPFTVIADAPANSRYGSHIKYRDMIYQNWNLTFAYEFAKRWIVGLELDYYTIYNTHKLPVKLSHNRAIVQSGQFTRSQYHVVSEAITQTYGVTFVLNYSFGGEGILIR